jgi:hypothetical protein
MIGFSTDLRNEILDVVKTHIDWEGDEYDPAHLLIYSGDRPSTCQEIDEYDNILLADFLLPYPCGTVNEGVLTFGEIADTLGLASGTISWGRIVDCTGYAVMDLSATTYVGTGDLKFDSLDVEIDLPIHCTAASITEGNP